MIQLILLIIFSGIIAVDRSAGFNSMISRPLVVSIIIGLIFGSVELCFLGGLIFEIIGLVDVPVGTRVTRDDSFGAYALSIILSFHTISGLSSFILALMLVLLLTYPVTLSQNLCRRVNKSFYLNELRRTEEFDAGKLIKLGLLVHFIQGILVYNLALASIYFFYNLFAIHLPASDNYLPYLVFTVVFLSGFLLRFLSGNSYIKYVIFISGLVLGWVFV
jgi:mannose/fructose/N-acetylgalactosamine-specific phosphotransferase system component IIC